MKRARFTGESIIGVLREHEAGAKTADRARKHGSRNRRCIIGRLHLGLGGQAAAAARGRERQTEDLLAEQMFDAAALRELLLKQ
jgi:putative transposase